MVSKIATVLGTVLLIAALSLWGFNQWQDLRAGQASSQHLQELVAQVPTVEQPGLMLDIPALEEEMKPEDVQMKEVVVKGYTYIGYLSIPALKLELPVMSQWDYENLDIAPCRYYGTMKGEDLVLLAHNFPTHFGKISKLKEGAEIVFTDMDGTAFHYRVAKHETLPPEASVEMTQSGYALTHFTCTHASQSRVVVRCDLQN